MNSLLQPLRVPTALLVFFGVLLATSVRAEDALSTAELVVDLGSESPAVRETAEQRLMERGLEAFPELFDATLDADAERARRARRLVSRLDRAAIGPLREVVLSEDDRRADRAKRLLDALTDRIVQEYRESLVKRVDEAEAVTAQERLQWRSQLLRQKFLLDESGVPLPTSIALRLAGRELLPDELGESRGLDDAAIARFRETGTIDDAYAAAWRRFAEVHGDDGPRRDYFAAMVAAEPDLMKAAAGGIAARGTPAEERAGLVAGGLHDFRSVEFQKAFRESFRGRRPEKGKLYPPMPSDEMFASVSALAFVDAELGRYTPDPTLKSLQQFFTTGLAGYFQSKQPVLELVKNPQSDRDRTFVALFDRVIVSAESGEDLQYGLQTAMYFRRKQPALVLAERVLTENPVFPNDNLAMQVQLLAGHALFVHGRGSESALGLARKLLDRPEQVRLNGYRKEQGRKYVELREFGLMAMLRILGKNHGNVGGSTKVTGYCPIKRFTNFEAIGDAKRWPGIVEKVDGWIAEREAGE